jgi:hypothetical protein
MQEETSARDLKDRFALIETMIAEGRRTIERWGWTFVLWGVAFYIAIAWTMWGPRGNLAWPVTMSAAALLTTVLAMRKRHRPVGTSVGRAIVSTWIATGITMFVLLGSIGFSGRFEMHVFVAVVSSMLGTANAASSMVLKWKLQFSCAIIWWAATIAACFGSDEMLMKVFVAAIFLCQIVFGIYGMIAESRTVRNRAAHA